MSETPPVDRTRVADFEIALNSLDELCKKYAWKGKDTWKQQTAFTHLKHAQGHLIDAIHGYTDPALANFEDFQSLAFRALAALYQTLVEKQAK